VDRLTNPRTDESSVNDVEVTIKVFKPKVDIVHFTPMCHLRVIFEKSRT
jgi:hypothetical protein